MANQQYIIDLEKKIMQVQSVINAIKQGMAAERKANSHNQLNYENRDCYGTLAINLNHIGQQCVNLATEIGIHRTEFTPTPKQAIESALVNARTNIESVLARPDATKHLSAETRQKLERASVTISLATLEVIE